MIELDGAYLEGGGQIVRTALGLSTLTGRPFRVIDIRKGRPNPGLKHQHLTAIKTLVEHFGARCDGAELGSTEIAFYPKPYTGLKTTIDIGTAGSITLLLQSLLIPAVLSKRKTQLELIGGTDVRWSPSIDYFIHVFLPQLHKWADVSVQLLRRGYYPKGGGLVQLSLKPKFTMDNRGLAPGISQTIRGKLVQVKGISHSSFSLDEQRVALRQARTAEFNLAKLGAPVNVDLQTPNTPCPGSGLTIWTRYAVPEEQNKTHPQALGADGYGEKGVKAEEVATSAVQILLEDIETGAPVDRYLADQLIPYLGLFGGAMHVARITDHCKTNMWVTELFLDVKFEVDGERNVISLKNS